jgi:hypothetical protein
VIHLLNWADIGRTLCAALRAIAGPTLPLPPPAHAAPERDYEHMAAEIEAFVVALNADLISAEDFAG